MPCDARPRRGLAIALAVAAVLMGCPLPQPVPGVSQIPDGGTITPPRIATDTTLPSATIIHYEALDGGCPDGGPNFMVSATVKDEKSNYPVEGRWFVDYDPSDQTRNFYIPTYSFILPGQPDGVVSSVTPFPFNPTLPNWSTETTHVVELVIATAFSADADGGLPNRTPAPGNETQVFRWVFVPAPGSGADGGCGP